MDLQEIITRGRFLFANAPAKLDVFEQVNGRRTARDIAETLGRHVNNVNRDLRSLSDIGLIAPRLGSKGEQIKRDRQQVFEKAALARAIPKRYFAATEERPKADPVVRNKSVQKQPRKTKNREPVPFPSEQELIDICNRGEDQTHEFKGQRTELRKVAREICGMLNARDGGLIFYGISDNGEIEGAGTSRQNFDQQLQNSVRNNIEPAPTVHIRGVKALGSTVLVIQVPPWDWRTVYHFDGRVLIRKGTNVFSAKANEVRKLHDGEVVA